MRPVPALRWAILVLDLEPVVDHEQGGSRRSLVVSYEPFHRSGRITICPITAARRTVRYPNEVPIPVGEGGQTKPGVILCHQVRTISLRRAERTLNQSRARLRYLGDAAIRAAVRLALRRQLGLDIPPELDGASATSVYDA